MEIKNHFAEKINFVVKGNTKSNRNLVFVHGFGTDKNGGADIFVDFSKKLKDDFRIFRFDFPGYGKSEGKQEDVNYRKQANDLKSVLDWVNENYKGEMNILAHSLGCFVTALLSPKNIKKTIFSAIPNHNTEYIIKFLQDRIKEKDGKVDEKGISIYPRSSGEVQKIGKKFWQELKKFEPLESINNYAKKTNLIIIHPTQDDIVGNKFIEKYKEINNTKYIETNGDHNYSNIKDRRKVIAIVSEFLD